MCMLFRLVFCAIVLFYSVVQAQSVTPSTAMALEEQGKLAEASAAWQQITKQHPTDAAAFASLGLVLAKQGRFTEAVPAYKKAVALNPKLPGLQLNLGLAEFKQGHFREAVSPFTAALTENPIVCRHACCWV